MKPFVWDPLSLWLQGVYQVQSLSLSYLAALAGVVTTYLPAPTARETSRNEEPPAPVRQSAATPRASGHHPNSPKLTLVAKRTQRSKKRTRSRSQAGKPKKRAA